MKNIIDKFYNYSEKEVKRLQPIIDKIEALDEKMSKLSNEELKDKTEEFKERINKGESLSDLLPEAFAVCREASFRILGMKHYRVQLLGGIILSLGRVAEMKTGEGKTLVATCPAYLNSLTGKGVHVVTTNEYLAKRDSEEMGEVYNFLGISCGVIMHDMDIDERREVYKKDIVYGINSEIGFDYLKDNMVKKIEERVQRGLNYAIVDEIDSILVDEARTPLIISGEGKDPTEYYVTIDNFVKKLSENKDYEIDEKDRSATLTDEGIAKLEKYFKIDNYADVENIKLRHHITQSLKANFSMTRDIDYVENDKGEIQIVDGFTGRIMDGRRFSDGLHQAIEAKEEVDIQPESKTLATVTLQNLFRMYNRLSGMSGTVVTESEEFGEIYNLDVVVVPTNRGVQRIDDTDNVYMTLKDKYKAVTEEIIRIHNTGQPLLVGTASIQKSEDISALLKRRGIKHNVLNAKNHEEEANIIKKAAQIGAITIATNMAGRGTDIKLNEEIRALGGLRIIGTERHDSVRVDNQLRGRAGRQGDVGQSKFFVSLEDDMIKNHITQRFKKVVDKLATKDGLLEGKSVLKAVENAQKAVEANNFAGRKNVLGYDDCLNKQREVIYNQRNIILESDDISNVIENMIEEVVKSIIGRIISKELKDDYLCELGILDENQNKKLLEDLESNFEKPIDDISLNIIKEFNTIKFNSFIFDNEKVKNILLDSVDEVWIEYLEEIDLIRQGVGLKSYKQVNPVQLFMLETSELFNSASYKIKENTVKEIIRCMLNENK